ncbi:MAG: amino acid ABC transporter substrate-binding protein [Clostridium butyricum]|nr:amino acid ABC transporter substrate-binding protein [Clostridium butyricum]
MSISKLLKKITVIGAAAVMIIGMIGCGSTGKTSAPSLNGNSESTLDKNELVIGLDDTFVPMGFKDENGELSGFDVELAKAVGEKLGKKIKFQSIDWSMKETELSGGNIDLIWNGYSINDERKAKVEFSKAYLNNTQVIVALSNSDINLKADLKGKKVGAQNESTAVDAVESEKGIIETFDGGKLITFENNNEALMDLEAGRLDAIVVDEILARYYIKQRGEDKYKILSENFGDEQYGVGIRKGDTKFVEAFNKALDEVIADGTASEISKKWFGEDILLK